MEGGGAYILLFNGGENGEGGIVSGLGAAVRVAGVETVVQGNMGLNLNATPGLGVNGAIELECPLTEHMVYTNRSSVPITGNVDEEVHLKCSSSWSGGRDIVLQGLKSTEYNGMKGKQGAWCKDKQRFQVTLNSDGHVIMVRPGNIKAVNGGG